MSAVTPSAVDEIPNGYNDENAVWFQFTVNAAASADTVNCALPARWQGTGFTVVGMRAEKWSTAAEGARVKTGVAITVTSITEATGVVVGTLGAAIDANAGRVLLGVCPSK